MNHHPDLRDNVFVEPAPAGIRMDFPGNDRGIVRLQALPDPVLEVKAGVTGAGAYSAEAEILIRVFQDLAECPKEQV
jgi:hypothetical protein